MEFCDPRVQLVVGKQEHWCVFREESSLASSIHSSPMKSFTLGSHSRWELADPFGLVCALVPL